MGNCTCCTNNGISDDFADVLKICEINLASPTSERNLMFSTLQTPNAKKHTIKDEIKLKNITLNNSEQSVCLNIWQKRELFLKRNVVMDNY